MWAAALRAWGRGLGMPLPLITSQELAPTQGYLDGPLPQGRGLWGSPGRSRECGPWGSCVLRTLGAQREPQVGPLWGSGCCSSGGGGVCVSPHRAVTACVSYRQECVEQLLRNMFDGVQTELCLVSGTQVLLTLLEPRRAG